MVDKIEYLNPPSNAVINHFANSDLTFNYPDMGQIVEFAPHNVRLVFEVNPDRYRINIKRWKEPEESAEVLCKRVFDELPAYGDLALSVNPFQLSDTYFTGWRCRKQFFDGGRAGPLIDMVFFQVVNQIYQLDFRAPLVIMTNYQWVFDTVLLSFRKP